MKIGLPGAMFLVFLVLKLINQIDWSWWWVTSPLWISSGIGIVALALAGLANGVLYLISTPKQRAANKAAKALRRMKR